MKNISSYDRFLNESESIDDLLKNLTDVTGEYPEDLAMDRPGGQIDQIKRHLREFPKVVKYLGLLADLKKRGFTSRGITLETTPMDEILDIFIEASTVLNPQEFKKLFLAGMKIFPLIVVGSGSREDLDKIQTAKELFDLVTDISGSNMSGTKRIFPPNPPSTRGKQDDGIVLFPLVGGE